MQPFPSFSPNPWTTWFLANIPDSFPEKEREDFWRSFNFHFKKFIVIHELFPGHYIQSKITRENPHPVRILFPYGLYSEGWATLCERVALEAGWDKGNKLTLLAPQFAKSLWGRLMRSPMQITSYFLGYKKFDEIYEFPAIFATRQN